MRKYCRAWVPILFGLLLVSASACLFSGSRFRYQEKGFLEQLPRAPADYPEARFIVLADPHYYHPELGMKGPAFQQYLAMDRKMLTKSKEILEAAISRIRGARADFVLICGDMTKDGSRASHKAVSRKLAGLDASLPVFVIPGNHDVRNGEAYRYTPQGKKRVPTVNAKEFQEIYAAFGYEQCLTKDPASLSYLAEPVPGLWLLALDSCLWRENTLDGQPHVDGRFSPETLEWMESMLIRAKRRGKKVVACMHHGLVEHYPENEKYYGEYVVDNSASVAGLLAAYGVQLVFTGHFHAQDITVEKMASPARNIFDVETGSLLTYPCPYRRVHISADQTCTITSRRITAIPSMGKDFAAYARDFTYEGTIRLADKTLQQYKIPEAARKRLCPQIARAYTAHLAGDEKKPDTVIDSSNTGLMGRLAAFLRKDLIEGWWTDLAPPDNELVIDLADGSWRKP